MNTKEVCKIYVITENDTYSIKEELKKRGALYKPEIGWFFTDKMKDFGMYNYKIYDVNNVFEIDENGKINFNKPKVNFRDLKPKVLKNKDIKEKVPEFLEEYINKKSSFSGNPNDKDSKEVFYIGKTYNRGTTKCDNVANYQFVDTDGNKFHWKTKTNLDCELYTKILISYIIKGKYTISFEDRTLIKNVKIEKYFN